MKHNLSARPRRAFAPFGLTNSKSRPQTGEDTSAAPSVQLRLLHGSLPVALVCTLALSGCVPDLNQPEARDARTATPESFGPAADEAATAGGEEAAARSTALVDWKAYFTDPHLQALIGTALDNNQELNIRIQEIMIAQSEIMARQGEYLPKVGVGVGAGLEKVGSWTSQGKSDEADGVPELLQNYRFGFDASWEVDIWKKLRNAAQAARYRYLASIEGRNFMLTQLVAEIANSYFELLAFDNQLEVLKKNIEIQTDALKVVRLQKEAARVTQLAVQRFEAEVLKNRSRQFVLEQKIIEAENRINFLVGRFPQPVARDASTFTAPLPNIVQAGVPSQLLDNRPDVRQAALQLEAAKLDVSVAKARFYPSLSIEAGVGYEAFNLKHLITTPESTFFGLAGGLVAPLLNRQGIKADYFAANAAQMQAVLNYERAILHAFTDVANQLAMIKNLQQSYTLEAQQVETLGQAIEVSNTLFQSARADYMEVLLTRRDSLDAQMDLIETRAKQRHALVNVYQALGGGWR